MRSVLAGVAGVVGIVVGTAGVARADEPMYACHTPSADSKISVQFKSDTSIRDLVTWAAGFTCKNIVVSSEAERAAPHVTVIAPKPVTPKQALALFVDALETAGLVVTVKADSILIKPGPSLPRHCPDVASSSSSPPSPAAGGAELSPYPGASDDSLEKQLQVGIKAIDATHYELTKAFVEAVLTNPMEAAKSARVVPNVSNGKPDGFKLYAIRPSSVFAKLGFANGDTVQKINGNSLDSADQALEVYTKLRDAKKLEVQIVRRGKPLVLTYRIEN